MQMVVSEDGKSLVALEPLTGLGLAPGSLVDVTVRAEFRGADAGHGPYAGKIVEDPITGLPVIDFGPAAPELTSEQVRVILADFP